MTHTPTQAHFDQAGSCLVIEAVTITQDAVLRECRHWSTGRRGEPARTALAGVHLDSADTAA